MNLRSSIFALLFLALVPSSPAGAQSDTPTPAAPPPAEQSSLEGFGSANLSCVEWNDGCASCLRGADGVHCSVTGIACQPKDIVCVRPK